MLAPSAPSTRPGSPARRAFWIHAWPRRTQSSAAGRRRSLSWDRAISGSTGPSPPGAASASARASSSDGPEAGAERVTAAPGTTSRVSAATWSGRMARSASGSRLAVALVEPGPGLRKPRRAIEVDRVVVVDAVADPGRRLGEQHREEDVGDV